jgi:Protein of unknown function (DUF4238)
MTPKPKRHHIVPEFYQRRFADAAGRIHVAERDNLKKFHVTNVENAFVQRHYYTIDDEDLGRLTDVEEFFANIVEPRGKDAMASMVDDGQFPPTPIIRQKFAEFCAFQFVRGEAVRQTLLEDYEATAKAVMALATPEMIREQLTAPDGTPPTDEDVEDVLDLARRPHDYRIGVDSQAKLHIPHVLETALELVPFFMNRVWMLAAFDYDALILGDEPVALTSRSRKPGDESLGVGIAHDIIIPVDSRHAVMMIRPDRTDLLEATRPSSKELADIMNMNVAYGSHRFVAWRPGTEPMRGLTVARRGAAVVSKDGFVGMMMRPPRANPIIRKRRNGSR